MSIEKSTEAADIIKSGESATVIDNNVDHAAVRARPMFTSQTLWRLIKLLA